MTVCDSISCLAWSSRRRLGRQACHVPVARAPWHQYTGPSRGAHPVLARLIAAPSPGCCAARFCGARLPMATEARPAARSQGAASGPGRWLAAPGSRNRWLAGLALLGSICAELCTCGLPAWQDSPLRLPFFHRSNVRKREAASRQA